MADKQSKEDQLHAMRHSLAHIMATAVTTLWPEAKLGVGPVVENGFYYDIDLGETKISEEDFPKIEKEMQKVIKADQSFKKSMMDIDEAIKWAKDAKQPYKTELLNDLKRAGTTVAKDLDADELGTIAEGGSKMDEVSFYQNGDFKDLCRGPHVESTGKVGAFKLMRIAGAYWRGKEGNPQMQRLYGVAFATDKELRQHLNMLEEAKKRDHRKLGQELDLFIFSDLVGSGLPLYTPRGTYIRNGLINFSEEVREQLGFERVWSPHITKKDLYEKSGHWDKFGDELFLVKSQETTDELVMKPMNCPHHAQIYAAKPRSYRDLPVKLMETTTNYRDEKTGELHGLSRVRSLTQDDSHTYCRPDQVDEIFDQLIEKIQEFYAAIDMELHLRLSLRDDSESYLGPQKLWDFGQKKLAEIAGRNRLEYYAEEGEAAFYGPKLDFMAKDAIGRVWQVATVQFDFVQPERFELAYIDEKGEKQRPIMIHCAIMGSFDRFFSVYIEHTAGKFPVWLAPEQIRLITVNQEEPTVKCAEEFLEKAKAKGLRVTIDNSNESVGKKIRAAEMMKVPYTLVIGEKEVASGEVVPRVRKDIEVQTQQTPVTIDEFLGTVANETKARTSHTSLQGVKTKHEA
ncbi:threonine--tRNA ligase [Candidatus Saccharibacteria bacterium]|nr:threonine--tRNA ligase [Candidatus Saccharibacteria bacterium]